VFDSGWWDVRCLAVIKSDCLCYESERRQRDNRRNNHDMSTAAEAAIPSAAVVRILRGVGCEQACRRRDRVTRKDLGCSEKQQEERNHAPDCRPVRHALSNQ